MNCRGLLVCGMCASVWPALWPWRAISRAFVRAKSSEFCAALLAVQYDGASKIRGVVAKTLGFLKIRTQGSPVVIGPYFFFVKLWFGGFHPEKIAVQNLEIKTDANLT